MKQLPAILGILSPQISSAITITGLAEQGQSPLSQSETDDWTKAYEPFIKAIKGESADLYLFLPTRTGDVEYRREQALASALSSTSTGFSIHNAQPLLRKARLIKSPHEIALIQHAIDITAEGFERAWSVAAPGVHEYDLQAEFDYTYTRRRARFGYPSIIGGGVNGTTLHYEENRDVLEAGSLIVMDAGAEYDNYSADVTRTIPASGKFTPEQALIYRLVYAAQQAAIASAHSGQAIGSVLKKDSGSFSGTAVDVLRKGLTVMGLMTDRDSDEQLRLWLPHGISHQLGMNVHDISKQGLEFSPGMVVTIEPGLYFRPDALDALPRTPENAEIIAAVRPAFERFKGIGIRIEDDILITEGGPKVLSAAIPSKLEDVEASLLRLRSLRPTL